MNFVGLADFNVPKAGFFLWIKVPGIKNTWKMIMQRGVTDGVIMAPGAAFMRDSTKPCNAIRASFSKASYKEMDLVFKFIFTHTHTHNDKLELFVNYNHKVQSQHFKSHV